MVVSRSRSARDAAVMSTSASARLGSAPRAIGEDGRIDRLLQFRVIQPSPQPNVDAHGSLGPLPPAFWVLVALTGVGAGLCGAALMALLRAVQHLAYAYHTGDFLSGVEHVPGNWRILVLLGAGVVAGVARPLLRRFLGASESLSEAIWSQYGRLHALRTFADGILSIVLVGMGVSLGREAAPKDAGAAIASKFSDWACLTPEQQRLLVACGAGAGMGAVYNVPLGGALFAVEVLLGTLSLPLVLPALATSLIATVVSWIYLPMQATYTMPQYEVSPQLIVWAIVAGPVIGLASALYIRLIAWASAHKPRGWGAAVAPILVFAGLGCVSVVYPQLLGNGKDVVQLAFLAQLGVPLLLALLVLKPLATAGCQSTGAPGGLFTPTMTYGALLGALLGRLWTQVWQGGPQGSYAVIGSGAVLAACTQGPVSSLVLLLELAHHVDALMIPLLIAIVEASLVAHIFESRSIYSARVKKPAAPTATTPPMPARRDG
jgi:chloride channel protein, CIC family